MQLAAAQEYARGFGDTDLVVLTDLNKSGRKGRSQRPGFDALLSAIEAGEVSAVYSYSLSRLSRSVRDIMAVADLCKAHGVPIRLARDTDPDPTTATGRAILALLGVMAQLEADLASERALDAVEARRARGDKMGGPAFEDTDLVLKAFETAGSYTGAAKLLSLRGVPTRNGNALWYPSAVRVILERVAPELLLPPGRARGAKAAAPFLFYRLIRCHCGTILTGWRRRSGPQEGYVTYRCTRGRLAPFHGKTHVTERVILDWARVEAERLRPPTDLVALGERNDADRQALAGRLERIRIAWINDLYQDEAAMLAEKREVDEALMQLDLRGRAVAVPPIAWNRDPREVNRALRAIWEGIQLDDDLRPVDPGWLLGPEWLAPRADARAPGSPAAPRG
jgi:DNA invertase Pin-like site-specific DNA recombinase